MVFRPARRRPLVIASSAPSADTGSGLTASASSPSATILPGDMARQRARADRGAGDRGADGKAAPRQRAADDLHQRGLAAEQMGAAGDVEEQAMRRIERHQRREAVAPVGDVVQRFGVGGFIGIEHRQFRADGAGIGERQADRKAGARRRVVERMNLQRVVLLGDDDAGYVVIFSPRGVEFCF